MQIITLLAILLTSPSVSAQGADVVKKIIVNEAIDKTVDSQVEKPIEVKGPKGETQTVESPLKRLTVLSFGAGLAKNSVRSPSRGFTASDSLHINPMHWDLPYRFFHVPVPWLSKSVGLHYSSFNGLGDYRYKTDGGTSFAGSHPFRAYLTSVEAGVRVRPFFGNSIQPYAELGGILGWIALQFSDSAKSSLSTQGSDYRLRDDLFAIGFYYGGGVEFDLTRVLGLSLAYRGAKYSANRSRLLDHALDLERHYMLLNMYFRF